MLMKYVLAWGDELGMLIAEEERSCFVWGADFGKDPIQ